MRILILGPLWRNAPIQRFLEARGHEVEYLEDPISVSHIHDRRIELCISSGYAFKVPADVVRALPDRIINLHATYLPWGKGIGTILFSFLEGSPKGVSIHFIDEEIDTGDVIVRRELSYSPFDTLRTYHRYLLAETEKLFCETFSDFLAQRFERIPQQNLPAVVHYHSRVESEKFMDILPLKWDTPVLEVEEMGAELAISDFFWRDLESRLV